MKFFLAILCVAVVAFAATDDDYRAFVEWTISNDKIYSNVEEHVSRFQIFKDNLALINHLNRQGKGVFAVNKFADLTADEFAAKYLRPFPAAAKNHPVNFKATGLAYPDSKDWRNEGAVNPIKNQASCGSCWAFSAVANMEGVYYVVNKVLPDLSEQQLVDCEHDCMIFPGTTETVCDEGCNGGLMPNAFTYAIREGMMTQKDYPYKGRDQKCAFDPTKPIIKFKSWQWVDQNENAMVAAVNDIGPLSVAVDATYWSYYSSGIYDSTCSTTRMNHGVAIVGYGKQGTTDYWIIRNSWGTSWGIKGYMQLIRGKNKCGINNFVCSIRA